MPHFGRIVLHDEKSREYEYEQRRTVRRRDVRHPMNAAHVDQFYLSGCVGFSGTNMLNTTKAMRSRAAFNRAVHQTFRQTYLKYEDGIRNYHESTVRDPFKGEYPPVDEGSSAIGLMKWWKDLGIIGEYRWTFTFDQFLAALTAQPVLIGTMWYDDMMATNSQGIITSEAQGSGGGHEFLGNGILWSKRLIACEQSWGEKPFNFAPTFYIPFDLAEELIIRQDGDVAVPKFL
jgi:hypothetical protein